jgi:protein-L-isoaspartate(D-aspartate) O-methyltransferase
VPEPLKEQLKEGGRMVIPVGPEDGPQTLCLLRKERGKLVTTTVTAVKFVPLIRPAAAPPSHRRTRP